MGGDACGYDGEEVNVLENAEVVAVVVVVLVAIVWGTEGVGWYMEMAMVIFVQELMSRRTLKW